MLDVTVRIEGVKELQSTLRNLRDFYRIALSQQLDHLSDFLLERIRLNTPIYTGRLRASLDATAPQIQGDNITVRFQSTLAYALKIHEDEFRLGRRSRAQPDQPEGGVGNKYITRVLNYHYPLIRRVVRGTTSAAVAKLFASGHKRVIRRQRLRNG